MLVAHELAAFAKLQTLKQPPQFWTSFVELISHPFINKVGAALGTQIVGITVIVSGINAAKTPADVTAEGLLTMKLAMLVLPHLVP